MYVPTGKMTIHDHLHYTLYCLGFSHLKIPPNIMLPITTKCIDKVFALFPFRKDPIWSRVKSRKLCLLNMKANVSFILRFCFNFIYFSI